MMNESLNPQQTPKSNANSQISGTEPTEHELQQLSDATMQEEYRREFLTQLKRRACPGCGEDAPF